MINTSKILRLIGAWPILLLVFIIVTPAQGADGQSNTTTTEEARQTPPPPLSEGIFPCSQCHEGMTVNTKRRQLVDEHSNIVLEHDAANRWCLDCHNPSNRDKLRLASGALINFSESYRLCGQCHGPTYRDWKAGVHGKRTGNWNGAKSYFLCVHCHNPHSPRVKQVVPFPAPPAPEGKPFFLGGKK